MGLSGEPLGYELKIFKTSGHDLVVTIDIHIKIYIQSVL